LDPAFTRNEGREEKEKGFLGGYLYKLSLKRERRGRSGKGNFVQKMSLEKET